MGGKSVHSLSAPYNTKSIYIFFKRCQVGATSASLDVFNITVLNKCSFCRFCMCITLCNIDTISSRTQGVSSLIDSLPILSCVLVSQGFVLIIFHLIFIIWYKYFHALVFTVVLCAAGNTFSIPAFLNLFNRRV